MAESLTTPGGIVVPETALELRFTRSGGPGGQHVNTSATRVELVCDVSAIAVEAAVSERLLATLGSTVRIVAAASRSQHANRTEAYRRLATRLDDAAQVPKHRRATRPSRAAKRRRLDAKRRRSRRKQDRRWRPED